MKKLILICGLLASGLSFGVVNSKSNSVDAWNKQRDFCNSLTEAAEGIMKARQRGVSLKDLYATLTIPDAENKGLYEDIMEAAYRVDIMDTDYDSAVAVLEFSNDFFESCMASKE